MKNIKYLAISIVMSLSLCIHAESNFDIEYAKAQKVAQDSIEDFPGSVRRGLLDSVDKALSKYGEADKNGFSQGIGDYTGGYQKGLFSCVYKYRLQAGIACMYASEEQRVEIVKQAQEDANQCLQKFDALFKSFQKYNVGDTDLGNKFFLDIVTKTFKP